MAGKKALFVGINKFKKYPQFALNGCVKATKNKLARRDVVAKVWALMKDQFVQNPQLEGNASNRSQAITY